MNNEDIGKICTFASLGDVPGLRDRAVLCSNEDLRKKPDTNYGLGIKLCVGSHTYSTGHVRDSVYIDRDGIYDCCWRKSP